MSTASKVFLYLIYFAIVIALGGFILNSARSSHQQPTHKTQIVSQQHKQPKPHKQTAPSSHGVGSAVAQAGSPRVSGPETAKTDQASLINTGPGNVIGLFAVAAITGTLFYRWRLISRHSPVSTTSEPPRTNS